MSVKQRCGVMKPNTAIVLAFLFHDIVVTSHHMSIRYHDMLFTINTMTIWYICICSTIDGLHTAIVAIHTDVVNSGIVLGDIILLLDRVIGCRHMGIRCYYYMLFTINIMTICLHIFCMCIPINF